MIDGDRRVAQAVAHERLVERQPLRARRAQEVLAQHLEHGGAHVAGEDRALDERRARSPAGSAAAGTAPKFSSGGVQPLDGSQPNWTAKTATSRMPARKAGTAAPTWLTADRATPLARRWRAAASVPSGRAISSETNVAASTRINVTCMRWEICGADRLLAHVGLPEVADRQPAGPVGVLGGLGAVGAELLAGLLDRLGRRVDAQRDLGGVAGEHGHEREHEDRRHRHARDEHEGASEQSGDHGGLGYPRVIVVRSRDSLTRFLGRPLISASATVMFGNT